MVAYQHTCRHYYPAMETHRKTIESAEADPTGQSFTFEAGASKQRGGEGWQV